MKRSTYVVGAAVGLAAALVGLVAITSKLPEPEFAGPHLWGQYR